MDETTQATTVATTAVESVTVSAPRLIPVWAQIAIGVAAVLWVYRSVKSR